MSPKVLLLAAALASSTAIVPVLANQPADNNGPAPTPPAATATAPGMPGQRPENLREKILFNLLDRNGDGAIDQQEFDAFSNAVFKALDANGDGKITPDEIAKAMPFAGGGHPGWQMGGRFMQHGPGFGPGMGPHFNRFGFDGHRPHPDWRQGQNDQGPAGQPGPANLGDNEGAQPPAPGGHPDFASLDKNGDGVLTPDEFNAAPAAPQPPAPQQ